MVQLQDRPEIIETELVSKADYQKLVAKLKRIEMRMRVQELVRLLPLALIAGGLVGLVAAIVSRLTPSLTVWQVGIITGVAIGLAILGVVGYSLLRRRSLMQTARRTDKVLGLKERVSTAIEGYNEPKHLGYAAMGAQQFEDARTSVEGLKANKVLPLRADRRHLLAALLIVPLLALALFLPNDNAAKAAQNAANAQRNEATAQQEIKKLEETKKQIEEQAKKNGTQNDPKTQEIIKQLDKAIQDVEKNKANPEESIAALEKAQQELAKNNDQQNQVAQKAAVESLARDLKNTEATKPAGDALSQQNNPDRFDKAASELNKTADNIQQLANDPKQAQQLSEALAKNAENFKKSNPDLAEKLQKASSALNPNNLKQDPNATKQALKDVANGIQQLGKDEKYQDQLQQAQAQLKQSEQAISQASKQGQNGQQNTGQAGSPQDFGKDDGTYGGDQTGQEDAAQRQNGQQNQQGQQGQNGQQGQQGQGQGQQPGQGQQGQNGQGQQGQGQGQQGQGQNGQGQGQQGQGEGKGEGEGQGAGEGQGQGNGNTGQGNGAGEKGNGAGKGASDNIYANPTFRRDQGTQTNLPGQNGQGPTNNSNTNQGGANGNTQVPYSDYIGQYSDAASQSLDKNYVPGTYKDLIKQYFEDLKKNSKQ